MKKALTTLTISSLLSVGFSTLGIPVAIGFSSPELSKPDSFIQLSVDGSDYYAQAQLTSESGNLIVERLRSDEESCATGKPAASYFVRGGVNGLLYPYDCSYLELRGEGISYKFADTSGTERCRGKAIVAFHGSFGQRGEATMIWEVEGAVSGYGCSTVGENYEYIMY